MNGQRHQKNISGLLGASLVVAFCASTTAFVSAAPQELAHSTADNDIPRIFTAPTANQDYVKREVMIPMRDGVKLHTVIVVPKGARNAPILLTRTPYNASKRAARNDSPHMIAILPQGDEVFVQAATSACSRTCAASTSPRATM